MMILLCDVSVENPVLNCVIWWRYTSRMGDRSTSVNLDITCPCL